jgi:hypothetical protein
LSGLKTSLMTSMVTSGIDNLLRWGGDLLLPGEHRGQFSE